MFGEKKKIITICIIIIIMISTSVFAIMIYSNSKNENEQYGESIKQEKNIKKIKQLGEMEYVEKNTKVLDNNGNALIIPEGFKILINEGMTVQEGIVIQDIDGNEFVWIPVGEIKNNDGSTNNIELARYEFNEDGSIKRKVVDGNPIIYEKRSYFEEETSTKKENASAKNIKNFEKSAIENGGYYLARYESSYKDGVRPYSKKSISYTAEYDDYDNIKFSEGMLWNNISQLDASKAAQNMYNNDNIESDLVNSYMWDTALVFIQTYSKQVEHLTKTPSDIRTTLNNTGNNLDKICNIYDLVGNVSELTTETVNAEAEHLVCTSRGGALNDDYYEGDWGKQTVYDRWFASRSGFKSPYFGFRVALYIK